jgi:hypothetical protein
MPPAKHLILALALVLAGCGETPKIAQVEPTVSPSASTSATPEATANTSATPDSTVAPSASPSAAAPTETPGTAPSPGPGNSPKPPSKGPKTTVELDEGYQVTTVNPLDLAKDADKAMKGLRDAEAIIRLSADLPMGKGVNMGVARVRDPQHVHLEYPNLSLTDEYSIQTERLLKNGGKVIVLNEKGRSTPKAQSVPKGSDMASRFPTEFPRLMLVGMVDAATPITAYLAAVTSDPKNYSVKSEERKVDVKGRVYHTVRVVVNRIGDAVKTQGDMKVQITFEAEHHVPVTVLSHFTKPNMKTAADILWQADWAGPKKFEDKEFVPKQK